MAFIYLFNFSGTPVSRIPIMAKQILDLFQLYNLVVKHGGLVQVTNYPFIYWLFIN